MWREVDFPLCSDDFPRVTDFVRALSACYTNGRVVHRCFRMPVHPIFEWYASRDKFHEMGFFEKVWLCPSVESELPMKIDDLNFYSRGIFEPSSPFVMGGLLAWTLFCGGAYSLNPASAREAKQLSDSAAEELIGDAYDSTLLYKCDSAWSDFFHDVAWDSTWVLIVPKDRLIHVILATDTD